MTDAVDVEWVLADVEKRLAQLVTALAAVQDVPLKLAEVRGALAEARWSAAQASAAARTLTAGRPLAATFPDGSRPAATLTPRQVLYLARLAHPGPMICTGTRQDDQPCTKRVMTGTEHCHAHATSTEREYIAARRAVGPGAYESRPSSGQSTDA